MDEQSRLTIEIKNDRPVSVVDFTRSFSSIGDQYQRFAHIKKEVDALDTAQLFIREIRPGSIIADLIVLAPLALPFAENANTIIDFASHLRTGFYFLLGKLKDRPEFKKKDLQNLSGIVEPVAKDSAAQLNVNTTINGNVSLVFNFNSIEANAIQNSATREIMALKEPVTGMHTKVLLYFYQARNDPKSMTGDRGIIESIFPFPVKVIFESEALKSQVLWASENPFTSYYIVDVAVETVEARPIVYKVLDVHETIEKPPLIE